MNDCENLFAEYKYDCEELLSFVKMLIAAAENEDVEIAHDDIAHNVEIIHEKLIGLHDKLKLLSDKLFLEN